MKEKIKLHKYSMILLIFIIVKLTISLFEISFAQNMLKNLGTGLNTLLISGFFIIYLVETLEAKANRLRYLKPEKKLTKNIAQDELKHCLQDENIKSVLINGKPGSGKTTLVQSSLDTKFVLNLNPFTDNISDNYLNYLFSEVRFANIYHYVPVIIVWLIIIVIQVSLLKADSMLLLVVGIATTLLILKNPIISRKLKQKLIINELKTLDLIVIDELENSLMQDDETLKLINFIHNNITENQKIVLLADLTCDLSIKAKLNQYYDYRLDFDNNVIKDELINTFNIDNDALKKLMLEVELTDLEKIKCHYSTQNITQKMYLNDQIFKLILMYHQQFNQKEIAKLVSVYNQNELVEIVTNYNQDLNNKISEKQFRHICELIEEKNEDRLNVYLNN